MRCGQTLVEYILVFVLLLGAVFAARYIHTAVRTHSARTAYLLGSDYP